jgi:hypothetical protein
VLRTHSRSKGARAPPQVPVACSPPSFQVDELRGADVPESAHAAAAAARLRYGLSVWFPSWAALQKELGEEMVRNGMVGAALEIFEKLELWDNLIFCLK